MFYKAIRHLHQPVAFTNSLAAVDASGAYISIPYLSAKSLVTGAPPTASITLSRSPASFIAFI